MSICDVGCMGSIQDFIETNVMWCLDVISEIWVMDDDYCYRTVKLDFIRQKAIIYHSVDHVEIHIREGIWRAKRFSGMWVLHSYDGLPSVETSSYILFSDHGRFCRMHKVVKDELERCVLTIKHGYGEICEFGFGIKLCACVKYEVNHETIA